MEALGELGALGGVTEKGGGDGDTVGSDGDIVEGDGDTGGWEGDGDTGRGERVMGTQPCGTLRVGGEGTGGTGCTGGVAEERGLGHQGAARGGWEARSGALGHCGDTVGTGQEGGRREGMW